MLIKLHPSLSAMTLQVDQRLWNGKTTADQSRHLEYKFPEDTAIEDLAASYSRSELNSNGGAVNVAPCNRTRD